MTPISWVRWTYSSNSTAFPWAVVGVGEAGGRRLPDTYFTTLRTSLPHRPRPGGSMLLLRQGTEAGPAIPDPARTRTIFGLVSLPLHDVELTFTCRFGQAFPVQSAL
jgi:hypothetical protein